MTPPFAVQTTSHYERLSNKLFKSHRDFKDAELSAKEVLSADPYNQTRRYHIKKLESVPAGDGQYRIRSGRFRFRYDISDQVVYLKACSLRREDTYR